MKRQFIIFLLSLLLITVFTLGSHPRVLADWVLLSPTVVDHSSVKIKLTPDQSATLADVTLEAWPVQVQEVVNLRLSQLNLKGYEVKVQAEGVEVTFPKHENIAYIINIIGRVGAVEFIDGGQVTPPLGQHVEIGTELIPGRNIYPLLFSGREIIEVVPPDPTTGEIFYQLTLQPEAAERFADFAEIRKSYICLAIDQEVVNCSLMYHQSGNVINILPNLGSGTAISLADLAIFLESGPLPAPLNVITN
jgi:preprotein translocase subunit SecD